MRPRKGYWFILVGVSFFFLSSAFSPMPAVVKAAEKPVQHPPVKLTISGGTQGGSQYSFAIAVATVVNRKVPYITLTATTSGSMLESVRFVGTKEADFAIPTLEFAYFYYKGETPDKVAFPNLRLLVLGIAYHAQAIVLGDSPIKSLEDMKNKRFATTPGLGFTTLWPKIFSAYGLDIKKDIRLSPLGIGDGIEALRNRNIDMYGVFTGLGNASYRDIATTRDVRFMSITPDKQEKLAKEYPWFKGVIPANTYPKQTQPIPTMYLESGFVVHKDVSEQVVYDITKTILESRDELSQIHMALKNFSAEATVNSAIVPLHPGAEKYYREIGVLK